MIEISGFIFCLDDVVNSVIDKNLCYIQELCKSSTSELAPMTLIMSSAPQVTEYLLVCESQCPESESLPSIK